MKLESNTRRRVAMINVLFSIQRLKDGQRQKKTH